MNPDGYRSIIRHIDAVQEEQRRSGRRQLAMFAAILAIAAIVYAWGTASLGDLDDPPPTTIGWVRP